MSLQRQMILYGIVGAIATAFDFAVFFGVVRLGVSPLVAQWIAASIGSTMNFIGHHTIVFAGYRRSPSLAYILSSVVTAAMIVVSGFLVEIVRLLVPSLVVTKLVVMGITVLVNFSVRRWWIFIPSSTK